MFFNTSKVRGAVVSLLIAVGAATAGQQALAAPALSAAVGKPLQDAQRQAQSRNFSAAVASAKQALAAAKTPSERFTVNEMLAYIYSASGNNTAAADAIEGALGTGLVPQGQVQARMKNVCQLRYRAQQWDRAIRSCGAYADRFNDRETRMLVGQIHYVQKNWAKAAQVIRQAVGGGGATKLQLQMLLKAYYESGNEDGQQWAREQLVSQFGDKDNWKAILSTAQNKVRGDTRYDLDILRLRNAVGVSDANQIMEQAQLAIQLGLSSEAKSVLEAAVRAGTIGVGAQKDRQMRLVAMARTSATQDAATVAAREASAKAAPAGDADVRIGEVLASQGKYDLALAAIQRGITKGVKDKTEATLRLGLANNAAGKRDAALKALDQAAKGGGNFAAIARLWAIHLRTGR